jgi:glycosyltransferase involved in cell wall biosynthesis
MQATLPDSPANVPSENNPPVEVSVVMPCLNEARTVGRCVAKAVAALEKLGVRREVIVADNGSTDGSQDLARAQGARVVHAAKRGYGSALQAGIAAARGTYVIMGDADDSYDFSNIEPFVTRLRAGDELVMGNRFRGGIQPGPCRGCTATSATRSSRASSTSSSAPPSATPTAGCAPSARTPTSGWACGRRAWSSPARWWSRRP